MQNQSRVIVRQGARELTPEEANQVNGSGKKPEAIHTVQTFNPVTKQTDGDFRE